MRYYKLNGRKCVPQQSPAVSQCLLLETHGLGGPAPSVRGDGRGQVVVGLVIPKRHIKSVRQRPSCVISTAYPLHDMRRGEHTFGLYVLVGILSGYIPDRISNAGKLIGGHLCSTFPAVASNHRLDIVVRGVIPGRFSPNPLRGFPFCVGCGIAGRGSRDVVAASVKTG